MPGRLLNVAPVAAPLRLLLLFCRLALQKTNQDRACNVWVKCVTACDDHARSMIKLRCWQPRPGKPHVCRQQITTITLLQVTTARKTLEERTSIYSTTDLCRLSSLSLAKHRCSGGVGGIGSLASCERTISGDRSRDRRRCCCVPLLSRLFAASEFT